MFSSVEIENIVSDVLKTEDEQLFLVEVLVTNTKIGQRVTIYIDGDQGVPIDTFAKISRAVSEKFDENDQMEDQYTLEVSSPGLDKPLKLTRQYEKNVGRNLKITLSDDKIIKGKLLSVNSIEITIDEEIKKGKKKEFSERIIPFDHIKKTNVLASFK